MSKVSVTKDKLDILANAISAKSGEPVTMTLDEMVEAVDGIETGGGQPTLQTKSVTPTESAQVITPDSGYDGLDEVDVGAISSTYVGTGITRRSSADMTVSGNTIYAPAGYYEQLSSKNVSSMSLPTSTSSSTNSGTRKAIVSRSTSIQYINIPVGYNASKAYYQISETPNGALKQGEGISDVTPFISVSNSGKITADVNTITSCVPVSQSGWLNAEENGVTLYLSGSEEYQLSTQGATTITPTTSQQTAVAAGKYTTGAVTVAAMPTGTAGTPTATKGTVSNHSVTVTPSVTNTGGYISGSTKTGTAVTVSASELDSGTKSISANGTGIDVVGYASVDVAVPTGSSHTATLTSNGNSADCYVRYGNTNYYTNGNTFTFTGGDTLTMRATGRSSTTGIFYVDGNIECEKSGGITLNNYSYELPDYDVSISFTYNSSNGVIYLVRPTLAISANGTYDVDEYAYANVNVSGGGSNLQDKTNINPTTSSQTITADSGYDGLSSVQINAMPSGTAGTPTATKGTVSNHSVSVTPSVTNTTGYITGSTKTGTAVTVSASELVSGSQTITSNQTVDVTNLAEVVVSVSGGGSGAKIGTATATPSSASASISFTGLQGEPTSFAIVSAADLATGASPYKSSAVVFDGTSVHGQYITNTSNAQMTASDSAFTKSYSNGTLTVTGTGTNFQANQYKLMYSYDGTSSNVGTSDVQVGSGVTSITFANLPDEPTAWSCIFKSNIGTSSGYTRALVVVNDGTSIYGMEMGSAAQAEANWSASYSNGSLTISSQSTSAGGYFHQPGYYQLTYVIGGEISVDIEPLTVTQNGTYAESGKAYSPVVVNVPSSGGANIGTVTMTNSSNQNTSIAFTLPSGRTPKAFFARLTSQIARNSNSRYYYVYDMRWDGSSSGGVAGNQFYMYSGTLTNVTSGYSYSQSGTTFTLSTTGSRSASPGSFYNGTYELVYVY